MKQVGVLALQGDFSEHLTALTALGVPCIPVRTPRELSQVDRLIIPGGESTVIGKLLLSAKLLAPLRDRISSGMPVWGTCAGGILLAKRIENPVRGQVHLQAIDITAVRNAFGRQLDSFETEIDVPAISRRPVRVLFIRAPVFRSPGKRVEVLARLPDHRIVAARERNVLVTAFHPELTGESALHKYFLSI